MFCPQCRNEYADGVTRCSECGVDLVAELPPQDVEEVVWTDLETVLESSDPARVAVVKSLLDAEKIPCFVTGDLLQEFIGVGRLGLGQNLATGPVQIQVPPEFAEEARALIRAHSLEASAESPVVAPPEGTPGS